MVIKGVRPLSVAKVVGCLYAALGFFFGAIVSCIALVGGLAGASDGPFAGGGFGVVFGAAAVVIFPLFYAGMGFVGALVMSALYNVVASAAGGIELDVQ